MKKTPEERLWDWLQDYLAYGENTDHDARKIYDYVTKYWEPKPPKKS